MKTTAKEILEMRLSGLKPNLPICLVLDFPYDNLHCLVVNFPSRAKPNFVWAQGMEVIIIINNQTKPARLMEVVTYLIPEASLLSVFNVDTANGKTVKDELGVHVYDWSVCDEVNWELSDAT